MRKALLSLLVVPAVAVLLTTSVASADRYGTAGCGLGSIVFADDKGIVQIFASTTNWLFGTQTFGITSGTSNCEETRGGTASAKAFIQTNREAMAKDIARGQGETISTLSSLAGCQNEAAVGSTLQSSFETIFPSAEVSDVAVSESVVETLKANPELACGQLT